MKKTVILTEAELKELISETVNEVKTNVLEGFHTPSPCGYSPYLRGRVMHGVCGALSHSTR